MKQFKPLKQLAGLTLLTSLTVSSYAHSPFVAPQSYIVEGETAAVIAGYAEAAFASEYAISGFDFTVMSPKGETQTLAPQASKHLTIADLMTQEQGTYKVSASKQSKNEYAQINKKWYRLIENHGETLPPLAQRDYATSAEVPNNAQKMTTTSHTQLLSFLSKGKANREVLAVTGKGLESSYSIHPNQWKANQTVTLNVSLNGKPQQNYDVSVLKQIVALSEKATTMKQKTDAKGQVKLTFPKSGQYIIEISTDHGDASKAPAAQSYRQHLSVWVN